MMYELKVNQQQSIIALQEQGWSRRRIARELGLDRGTVGKYLAGKSKPATPHTGSTESLPSKPATNPQTGSAVLSGPVSLCDPWREQIEQGLERGLSIQRIYQDLVTERQFAGSYYAGNAQLGWSSDHRVTWTWADWKFTTSFGCPGFLNFGRNYAGARDGFVYIYSPDCDNAYERADRMVLARAPKERVRDRDAYEFFVRLEASQPVWTKNIAERGAVFSHLANCYRSGITYHPALRRYLWCQTGLGADPRFAGGLAIYDAPEPWGPWTTAYFSSEWDIGPGETSSIPTKWFDEANGSFYLLFSGNDSFSLRKATIVK